MTLKTEHKHGICVEPCDLFIGDPPFHAQKRLEMGTAIIIYKDLPSRHLIGIYNEMNGDYTDESYYCLKEAICKIDKNLFLYLLAIIEKDKRCAFVNNKALVEYVLSLKNNDKVHAWVEAEMNEYVILNTKKLIRAYKNNQNFVMCFELKSMVIYKN